MGRKPCCSKEESLNRGAWTAAEDKILTDYVKIHGEGKWRCLPKKAGLQRCGKSCRLRWLNYLRPDIKRGNISLDEKELIIRLHNLLGNRWSLIAGRLPGRTDNEIKNYWNTNIRKKLQDQIPSSSSPKILNPCQEKAKFGDKKPLAGADTYPIRTRPSKCTKMFFSTLDQKLCEDQDQVIHTKQAMAAPALSITNGSVDQSVKESGSLPEFNLKENDPSKFLTDFEMDDHFLNYLDTVFLQLPILDDTIGGDICTIKTCEKGYHSSQNSDETTMLLSQLPSLDDTIGGDISTTNTCYKGYYPPQNSDETTPWLSDNKLQDSDFAWMDE